MNAVGRRLSESRVRENLMHGLRWQEMETETTAPSLDPTPIRPGSGKDTAKDKGVHREVESEGSRRQISGLTNRNHIRLQLRIRLHYKPKSNNYSELTVVNVADIWRERNVWYQGRSRQQAETEYETCSNNEWREVSRGHSTKTVANVMGRTEL